MDGAFLGRGEGPLGGFSPPGKNSFFIFREVEIRSRWAGTEAFLTQDGQAALLRAPETVGRVAGEAGIHEPLMVAV